MVVNPRPLGGGSVVSPWHIQRAAPVAAIVNESPYSFGHDLGWRGAVNVRERMSHRRWYFPSNLDPMQPMFRVGVVI